ncbi:hypothetical protein ACA910_014824 [Epithemia clementina (nom. ined.)]
MMADAERDLSRIFARLGVSTVEEAEQKIDEQGRTIRRLDGSAFCTVQELYNPCWQVYSEDDFKSLCRNWEEKKDADDGNNEVFVVYDKTRMESRKNENRVATTSSLMTVNSMRPVRLCSHDKVQNYAEKAHLCPKTGAERKVDTWIYAAAAVLGMPSDNAADRQALLKALRGSVKEGSKNVIPLTGLNRSPFNLLSFVLQETWFDKHPGVVALPCLNPDEACKWHGESYSIIILCQDVTDVSTADDVAASIALTRTPEQNLHEASEDDITKATQLLRTAVLSSAYCLMEKEGPGTEAGQKLWKRYRKALLSYQHAAHMIDIENSDILKSAVVPVCRPIPKGRLVAKINLAEMVPPEPGTPAYPDPLLLAFKSSVNWTRPHGFQMIAEAEPQQDDIDLRPQFPGLVYVEDKGSVVSSDYGSLPHGFP